MVFYGDVHIHSVYSDGSSRISDIVNIASRRNLKVISITDHNTFQGSVKAKEFLMDKKIDIILLYGNERRTNVGDILVYCMEPHVLPYELDELLDYARENNCIIIPAHPFDLLRKGIGRRNLDRISNRIKSIECYNADALWFFNEKARAYAEEKGLTCTASSDAHIPEYIGAYKTIFQTNEPEVESIFKTLSEGRVEPYTNKIDCKTKLKRITWGITRRIRGHRRK